MPRGPRHPVSRSVARHRRQHLSLALALLAALAVWGGGRESDSQGAPSNILLLTLDTTRADVLGCYGGWAATPEIDRLAAEGLVFDRAYSNAFGTTPSHATLLTSTYPAEHGVYNNETVLPAGAETLAEALADQGYATAAFVSGAPLTAHLGLDQGFAGYDDRFRTADAPHGPYASQERRARDTASRLLEWLPRDETRFFAWAHFYDAHQPYAPPVPPDEYAEVRALFEQADGAPRGLTTEAIARLPQGITSAVDAAARARYAVEIAEVDRAVGRILEELRARGLYERTIVVLVADHGENFLDRGISLAFEHDRLFGDVARVPLVVKPAGPRREGRRVGLLLGNIDIAPTLLDLVGVPWPQPFRGRSFASLITEDDDHERRQYLVLEGAYGPDWPEHPVAVVTRDWSFQEIWLTNSEPRPIHLDPVVVPGCSHLFDLASDPHERLDLFRKGDPRVHEARAALARHFSGLAGGDVPGLVASDAHREALRTLGYVH